jgi:hypothetical protein
VLVDVIVVVVVVVVVNAVGDGDGDGDELNDASSGRADGHEPICTHSDSGAGMPETASGSASSDDRQPSARSMRPSP